METQYNRKYLITNEVLNAVTHGVGVVLSIIGFVFLLGKATSELHYVSFFIYGVSLLLLFLASTLYHSLIFTKAKKVFQVFDHCSIYLLIAGTYTPYCLLYIKGTIGIVLLSVIWLAAIVGIVYKSLTLSKVKSVSKLSTIIYNVMGWAVIAASRRRCRLYRRVAFLQHEKPPVYARSLALIRDAGCDADVLLDLFIRK